MMSTMVPDDGMYPDDTELTEDEFDAALASSLSVTIATSRAEYVSTLLVEPSENRADEVISEDREAPSAFPLASPLTNEAAAAGAPTS
jgi:ribosomal protein L12E/L44/L45/RPP1/RPP2